MNNFLIKPVVIIILLLGTFVGFSQEFTPFTRSYPSGDNFRYQTNIKGDLTFIANDIVNRDGGTATTRPVDPYDETGNTSTYNDWFDIRYIDIDADISTFNSSSAEFTFGQPDCNRIRYAALYWSATYVSEEDGSRSSDFNQVKFQVPGGSYVDITADEVLYDGNTSADAAMRGNSPYACYADVTSLVTALADPAGTYTVGNIRVSQGFVPGGISGGWTLVIVYENPTLTGKLITTYDGFARVRTANPTIDIDYTGFTTIPAGSVRANIGAAALEGDNRITGDEMAIRASLNAPGPFYRIRNSLNPEDNFFNSNITINGTLLPGRTPSSINTLGYDTDLLNLPVNTIPNNETAATFRFTSTGDQYFPFFNSFNIEIIEPEIVLEKRVEDIAGNDITGLGVNLGQTLDYVLSFENIGNDDADQYTIRDVLPINVTLDEAYFSTPGSLPTGVTYTFDPATRTVLFSIPNDLVTDTSPVASIRMRVRVAENCFDFIDACTDLIQNLAYSTYRGVVNDNEITDDPSVTDFDTCGFITPGATNFLLDDLSDCNFRRTVQLCGDNAILDSGDNFDSYVWVRDENNNGLLDPTDTVLNDGDPDNDPSTLLITQPGTYIVDKIVADPCKGFKEIIDVVRFGDSNVNPIIEFFNDSNSDADPTNDIQGEIVSCSVDGDLLPKIFLCGINDAQLLQVNIVDATSIVWEQLDEGSCADAGDDCANKNQTCDWDEVGNGNSFSANAEGKYRLVVTYQNGCFNRFYFNVFQNTLDIQYTSRDVVCETPGNITVTNIGSGYGFQLVNVATNTIEIPFSTNNGPVFDFTSNGAYRIEVTQLDNVTGLPIDDACVFSTPEIGILDRDMQVDITTTEANCNAQGSIQIDALDVFPNYSFELRLDDGTPPPSVGSPDYYPLHPGGTLIDSETAQPVNSYTFNVNAGDYFVVTRSDDGCLDAQSVRVDRIPDPILTALTIADIGCSAGSIELTRTGGQGNPDFQYAIWSIDGTLLHTPGGSPTEQEIVDNIDLNAFQNDNTFTFGWRDTDNDGIDEYFPGEDGTYVFVMLDANNCYAISNPVTINDVGSFTIDSVAEVQPSCSGDANGQLTINVLGGVAPYEYSIDNGTTYQSTPNFVGLVAGPYELRVLDSSGCDVYLPYNLTEPFPLSASAGVSRDASCDPNGAEVRITNVLGGVAPYEYSFDGGATWGASAIQTLPPGDYTVFVRDAFCSFPMNVTVEGLPTPPDVALTPEVDYNCDGTGTITASPSIAGYNYRYELDGVPNAPDPASNVFTNVAPGTYTVTTYYTSQTPPTPSLLLLEDFGVGNGTIPSPDTRGYAYEDQTTSTVAGGDANSNINDFEYSVTNRIVAPFGSWLSPNDHTDPSDPNGRFLVINVGTPSPGQIIYTKPIQDIIPNRPLRISLNIFNVVRSTSTILNPDLTIEIVDAGGTVIQSIRTGQIPKNTGPDDWVLFTTDFDPGANTNLDFVIRSEISGNSGNDLALDDIQIFQIPEVCELFVETPVTVAAGRVFAASVQSSTNVSCNGLSDGTITFEVENFDSVAGFEYSVDGGTSWITSLTSPVTTNPVFGAGTQTILLRKADEITCTTSITSDITEPTPVVATAAITTALTCTDGATITAAASGGTPTYDYQLEDNLGNVIGTYDFNTNLGNRIFPNLPQGDYVVFARDANGCIDRIDAEIEVLPLDPLVFTAVPTTCYDGSNNATIVVNVTDGNGGYQFRIDGGPWRTPSPSTATSYTFSGLANGSYDIEVRDQLACPITPVVETVTINPSLTATTDIVHISSCNDGSITVNATGGDGNYLYAFMPAGSAPVLSDFIAANIYAVTNGNDGNYDVYVRDNNAIAPDACNYMETVTVNPAVPLTFTATPTAPECFDGVGSITVAIATGNNPYTIELIDLDNGGASNQTNTNVVGSTQNYFNLSPGDYTVIVTDASGCDRTETPVTIINPDELIADIVPVLPPGCDPDPNLYGFFFDNYTTTLGALEFSADGGATWQLSDTFVGPAYSSGTEVEPSIRVVGTNCQVDFPRYTIPYPLDDLNITLTATLISCSDLQVSVQGTAGLAPYEYTYSEDPANFDPATAIWTAPTPLNHAYNGLIPGRTYVFYVRDASGPPGCVRQSSVNVNDVAPPPVTIDGLVTPSCSGLNNGEITYTVTETTLGELGGSFDWELFRVGSPAISVDTGSIAGFTSGDSFTVPAPASLSPADYYIEIRGAAPNNCIIGSENIILQELDPITFTPVVLQDITCANPGVIQIQNATGGGGMYTYTLSSSNFIADIATTNTIVEVPLSNLVDATATPFDILVQIADQFNCPVTPLPSHTVAINTAQAPTIASVNTTNCVVPFSIEITMATGLAPYLYSIDGGANYVNNGGVFTNVAVGTYAILVIDANGCTVTDTAEIYPVFQANAAVTKLLDCTVSPDAIIRIGASDGSGSYDFEVSGPQNQARTALPSPANTIDWATALPGNYNITVYDNNRPSCPPRIFTVEVMPEIRPIVDAITTTDVTCIGDADGTITISAVNNGVGPYTFEITAFDGAVTSIAPTSTTATTATFTGLAPTTTALGYVVTVTGNAGDNNCPTTSTAILISEPNPVVVTMDTPVEFGCTEANNGNNASISVLSVTGGSNNYVRYEFINDLNPGVALQNGSNTTFIETNPLGGSYTINVYDENGCLGTATASIAPFVQIYDPTVTTLDELTCIPGNDARIQVGVTVSPVTATPNLEYVLNGINVVYTATNNTGEFTGLDAGNYRVTITNLDTNCIIETVHTLDPPEEMEVVATKLTDEECLNNGVDDGSFSVGITNYTGTYDYQVFDNSNNPVAGQSGSGDTATVLPPITGLPGGVYYVRITQTQAPFCIENSNVITVLAPSAPIAVVPFEELGVSCSNDQGSISVIPTGGVAPYTISWNNTTTGQSGSQSNVAAFVFSGLSAGDYTFTVTDAFSCTETAAITLVRPEDITATIAATTLSCFGDNNASVTATVAPRATIATYGYRLNVYADMAATTPLQTTPRQALDTFNNLGAGFYSITVLDDDNGCSAETPRVEIIAPTEVVAQLFRTGELTCTNLAELELRAIGGTGPYSYSEDGVTFLPMNGANGPNTHVFTGVSAGTYSYFVRDAFSCPSTVSNEITEDPIMPLSLSVDRTTAFINCTGDSTASIVATADGGLGNYQYALFTDSSLNLASRIAGPQSQGVFNGLPAGTYYVEVTSEDCTVTPEEVVITDPIPLSYTEDIVNVSCFGENDASITVTLSGGAGGYQYAISPNLNQFDDINTFTDLSPGDYTIIAQDANGCFEQLEYTIIEPTLLEVIATPTPEVCVGSEDGTITLEITGGTAPYRSSLNSNSAADFVQDRLEFTGLASGNYLVFVRDANDCEVNIVLDIEPGVNLNAVVTPVYECDGDTPSNYVNITLEDQTVLGEVLYALDSIDPSAMQLTPDFRNTAPGTHFIAVSHANGCVQTFDFEIEAFEPLAISLEQSGINQITATTIGGNPNYTYYIGDREMGEQNVFTIYRTDTYVVTVVDQNGCEVQASLFMEFIDVEFPNFFTPDGDGQNDFWIPRNMETFPEILIIIFDRYGREVYRMGINDPGWDGLYNQNELPTGDYWYVVRLNGEEDNRELIGHFTLYR